MNEYEKKPETVDLAKLAEQLLKDLEAFKGEGLDQQITVMYLYNAFTLGDKHGWWQDLDKSKWATMVEKTEGDK
jgi:hypothetical protein